MLQVNREEFQVLHLDDAFPEDEVEEHILNIWAYLSRTLMTIHAFWTMEMDSCTLWMREAHKRHLLCIYSTKIQERCVAKLLCTSHLSLASLLRDSLQYKMQSQVAFSHWLSWMGKVFNFTVIGGMIGWIWSGLGKMKGYLLLPDSKSMSGSLLRQMVAQI